MAKGNEGYVALIDQAFRAGQPCDGLTVERASEAIGAVVPTDRGSERLEEAARELVELLGGDREALQTRTIALCTDRFIWERYLRTIREVYGLPGTD